jgi:hypothetical protein
VMTSSLSPRGAAIREYTYASAGCAPGQRVMPRRMAASSATQGSGTCSLFRRRAFHLVNQCEGVIRNLLVTGRQERQHDRLTASCCSVAPIRMNSMIASAVASP